MKLQTKIFLNSFVTIMFALLIMAYIIIKMIGMQTTANEFSNNLLQIEELNSEMVGFQQSLDNFGKNPSESNLFNAKTNYENVIGKVELLNEINVTTVTEIERVSFITNKVANMESDMNIVINEGITVEAMQLSSQIHGIMNDIFLLKLSMSDQYSQLSNENNVQILYTSIGSAILLLFVSSTFNFVITRRIVKPISMLSEYSEEIASGNLSIEEIKFNSNDEVGQLTKSFNKMKSDLQILIEKIQNHANELQEKNERINDSIDYAKRIQEAVLPLEEDFDHIFQEHFLIWRPRDTVGGDFYWSKRSGSGIYVAIADCTGHGVPGALMTTLSISALNHIVEEENDSSPATILEKLNHQLKRSLSQEEMKDGLTDDGLDIGLFYISNNKIIFAGAKQSLFSCKNKEVVEVKGDRKSIGYRRTPSEYPYSNKEIEVEPGTVFYITTDGYIDQNGSLNEFSLGKTFFVDKIKQISSAPLNEQKAFFQAELEQYMGDEAQRDDITVFAFKLK